MNDAGKRIRERREFMGMTQEELAHKVGYKSRVSINKLELERDIPVRRVKPIADALEISVADLMGWEEAEASEENAVILANIMKDRRVLEASQKLLNAPEDKKVEALNYIDYLLSK